MNEDPIELSDEGESSSLPPEKPLQSLFKRLIGNGNKQNTVLTNAQLTEILREEFHIEVASLHVVELEIYMNVLKKFLKDWPQWDEFDKIISDLKNKNDNHGIETILYRNYQSLKQYILVMLNIAEPIAKDSVKSVEEKRAVRKKTNPSEEVALEISCTRSQLNQLIFNCPQIKDGNSNVFNVSDRIPSRITPSVPSFQTIINWAGFHINFNLPFFSVKWRTIHELKHVLVNKKLKIPTDVNELNRCYQEKPSSKAKIRTRKELFEVIDDIAKYVDNPYRMLLDVIKQDLLEAPLELKIPGMYRRYMNKYPYVRYLYTDVNPDQNSEVAKKYDLHLEETISPMWFVHIVKLNISSIDYKDYQDKIYIECYICKVKLSGAEILEKLKWHYLEFHHNEPDWECKHCNKSFPMTTLSGNRWYHTC